MLDFCRLLEYNVNWENFTLVKAAGYLDCSVDYLLCRTPPNSHNTHVGDVVLNPQYDEQLLVICQLYDQLDTVSKAIIAYADELNGRKTENEVKIMGKFLNGSNGTGKKILKNFDLFLYDFKEQKPLSDGSIIYYFTWEFNSQHGYISIQIKDNKISNSSQIGCDEKSPNKFGRPLGLYNDRTLGKLFEVMMKTSCEIVTTGFYST